jgi:multicomponent Na+:H+ antiporter subunit G
MSDVIIYPLLIIGTVFMLLAAIGVTRMPDVYMRVSTVTKASTLGAGLLLLAVVISEASVMVTIKAAVLVVFGFLTSPIAAHMLGRAAYESGVPLWEGTLYDEMTGHAAEVRHEHEAEPYTEAGHHYLERDPH